MSKEIDAQIDAVREKIQTAHATTIGMGNYKQYKDNAEQITYEIVQILDDVNAQQDTISPTVMEALKKAVTDMIAKKAEGDK